MYWEYQSANMPCLALFCLHLSLVTACEVRPILPSLGPHSINQLLGTDLTLLLFLETR